ncbi:MAG: OmpA family protein [Alphaproteobacteria bacterium]|nr:OmpA family protein [Alphaproteobacteria bacterium]
MRTLICSALASIALTSTALAQQDVEGHPLITPYEGSQGGGEFWSFDEYRMIVGFDFDARSAVTETIQGRVTRLYYESPDERSEFEIFTNYREALDAAGFQEIWACAGDGDCTTGSSRNAFTQANGMRAYNGPNSRYAVGRLTYEDRIAYIAVVTGRHGTSIDIIETDEMDRGMVSISLDSLADGLDANGRVRVDGLLFAHDSDELLPDSSASLEILRDLLGSRPELEVYVVGHTDMTGSLEYNLDLSRRRAASVVRALVEDYAIPARRLDAHGIGPLAPETSNEGEEGRALNRRVEIVAR